MQKYLKAFKFIQKMSVFTQKLNPVNGNLEWQLQDENYDYHQEIARSAYADMLHDTERNQKYYSSLKKTIAHLKNKNISTNVLDIGTGTGLLSMMAAKCEADSVTACEAFEPIANCARQVIENNGYKEKIKLVSKHSTGLTVGIDCDLKEKANILVAELFDTELIGEGAIPTFNHAHKNLLKEDCYVIPCEATVFAQVVESQFAFNWHQLNPVQLSNGKTISLSDDIINCPGAAAVCDCQLDQIPSSDFHLLTEPIPVLKFDFTKQVPAKRTENLKIHANKSGRAQAVFMWWELKMDFEGEIILSCAPKWAHPDGNKNQWRDHWMQAVYFLPKIVDVEKGQALTLQCSHDDYSLWFNLENEELTLSPVCICGAHVAYSRTKFGMMNDAIRLKKYTKALERIIKSDSICLGLSDGSWLPLIAAKLGAKKIFAMDSEPPSRRIVESLASANKLKDRLLVLPLCENNVFGNNILGSKVDVLIGEPYFLNSVLPWDNLRFWYLRSIYNLFLSDDVKIMPKSAVLKGVGLNLDHLWKIKAPVGVVEDFNIQAFDQLIRKSSNISDDCIDPQPLWEYPGIAVTHPWNLLQFNFIKKIHSNERIEDEQNIPFAVDGLCNAIALWMEWHLDEYETVSSGPTECVIPGKPVVWDRFSKQGVYFFPPPIPKVDKSKEMYLNSKSHFNTKTGEMHCEFSISENKH